MSEKRTHNIQELAEALDKRVRRHRRWQIAVTCLSAVVVFVTVYMLVLPAVTLESDVDVPGIELQTTGEQGDGAGTTAGDGVPEENEGEKDGPIAFESETRQSTSDEEVSEQLSDSEKQEVPTQIPTSEVPSVQSASANGLAKASNGLAVQSGALDEVLGEGKIANAEGEQDAISWRVVRDTRGVVTLYVEGKGDMPDYASYNSQPWREVATDVTLNNIVVGEGISRVGDRGFDTLDARGTLSLPSTLKSIGDFSFANNRLDGTVTIPDAVTAVGNYAFRNEKTINTIDKFVFGSSVETIGGRVLYGAVATDGEVVLPSGLVDVSEEIFYGCAASSITMTGDSANSKYFVGQDDGAFYRRDSTNPETWTLIKYPTNREMTEYVLPTNVTAIEKQAFYGCQQLQKVTIPDGQQVSIPSTAFSGTRIVEIYLGDSVTFPEGIENMFANSSLLEHATLPTGANCGTSFNGVYSGCSSLQEATIPASITSIDDTAFNNCTSMGTLIFDAAGLVYYPQFVGAGRLSYDLVIGSNVDYLSSDFDIFGEYARGVIFGPNNHLAVEPGALSNLPSPLSTLSGELYVDDQGVVYSLDAESRTATVAYCSPSVDGEPTTSIAIPETVQAASGESYTVTTVGRDAIRAAQDLTSITFAEPGSIVLFETNALANCPTLTSVNDKNSVEEIQALFRGENSDIRFGYNAFANTGLKGSVSESDFEDNMQGPQSLEVEGVGVHAGAPSLMLNVDRNSQTLEWAPSAEDDETGGWSLLTGATLNVSAQVNNLQAGHTYRIFAHFTDAEGMLAGFTPGETIQYDNLTVKCYATEDPYTFCYEVTPPTDTGTMEFRFGALYPTLTSPGGGLVLWGEIGDPYEEADLVDGVVPVSSMNQPADDAMIYAHWKTIRQEYKISKTARAATVDILAPADGGYGTLAESLTWTISFAKDTESGETPVDRLGEDYVTSIALTDSLTLPEGVEWKAGIVEAMRSDDFDIVSSAPSASTRIVTIEVDGTPVFSISNTSSDTALDVNAILDEKNAKNLIFACMFRNNEGTPVGSDEMVMPTLTVTLHPDAVDVDMERFDQTNPPKVSNTATSTLRYQNSPSKSVESQNADVTLSADEPVLNVIVESELEQEGTAYLGENINYVVTVSNDGSLAYQVAGEHKVSNALDKNLYLKPESIEAIFEEASQKNVDFELTIEHASLATWEKVTPAYGQGDAYKTVTTSDIVGETANHTLVITKQGNQYQLTIDDSNLITGDSVSELLKNAGYDVRTDTTYTCRWTLSDEQDEFDLGGGSEITFNVPATTKDTFQHLSGAMSTEMPEANLISVTDRAYLKGPNINKSDSATDRFTREARVEKSPEVFRENESVGSNLSELQDLDILGYSVDFTHWGNGSYENLPLVDSISGAQRLLVPVEQNKGKESLEGKKLDTVWFKGVEYYILDQTGDYTDIVVGWVSGLEEGQNGYWTAAQISVGSETIIEWYATDLPANDYILDLGYQTIVQASSSGGSFAVGNTVRVNDRDDSCLYSSVSGGGSMVGYSKQIVSSKGETPDDDLFYADQYSPVKEGQEVTYRLTITNGNSKQYTLNGLNIADALPHTNDAFAWKKGSGDSTGNVRIEFKYDGNIEWENRDSWYIGEWYPSDGAHSSNSYILWPEVASLKLEPGAIVYIYVTLTFPSNREWQDYVDAVNGNPITNTLWVYDRRDIVTHDLDERGYALLQKGVFATHDNDTFSGVRDTYSTSYGKNCGVLYYVVLLNSGAKRLYINDIQDQLPRGFTMASLRNTPTSGGNPMTTVGGKASEIENPFITFIGKNADDITCVSARMGVTASDRNLRFSVIGDGSGDNAIKYDEEREKYYLERNEALVFGYVANASQSVASTDAVDARNTVAMPYTEYTTSGVASVDSEAAKLAGVDISVAGYTDTGTYRYGTNDDTDPGVYESDYVFDGGYGFSDDTGAKQWLMSQVDIDRGSVKVRTEKRINSYATPGSDTVIPYTGSITSSNATSNWTIRAYNDGDCTVQGYVFTDKLPSGFTFVGNVAQSVVYNKAGVQINHDGTGYFSIAEHDFEAEEIDIQLRGVEGYKTISTNGSWYLYDGNLSFRIFYEDGCEVLQLFVGFGPRLIPPGGYAEFTYSAINPSTTQTSGVYQNIAYVTPVRQNPSEDDLEDLVQIDLGNLTSTNVSNIQNEGGWSAEGSAVMNVTLSATTSSSITVTEQLPAGSATNSATSNWEQRAIRLQNEMGGEDYGSVRYELTVDSGVSSALDQLVLIDTLPREGDSNPLGGGSSRGSEYAIWLAEKPEFKVTVQTADGTATELGSSEYRIEYMTENASFDEDDWSGDNGGWTSVADATGWSNVAKDVTALRVVIEGENALPVGAKVCVSFNAQVADNAGADAVAWNSFGYRGVYNGGKNSFEAMPEPVGVRTPAVPTLKKIIEDSQGNSAVVTDVAGKEFRFLLYKGNAIANLDVTSEGWESKLSGRDYRVITLAVSRGESSSDLELTPDGIKAASDGTAVWTWKQGEQYNVAELSVDDDRYSFDSFTGGIGNSYTFSYDRDDDDRIITCTNIYNEWSITLNKIDGDTQEPLSGSTFALYSPSQTDAMTGDDIPDGVSPTQDINGNTYYLMGIEKIEDGEHYSSHTWEGLFRSSYYLQEVGAPDGYALPTQGTMIYRRNAEAGVYELTVENYMSYELPSTGGRGRAALIAAGATLALGSIGGYLWKRRREGGDAL